MTKIRTAGRWHRDGRNSLVIILLGMLFIALSARLSAEEITGANAYCHWDAKINKYNFEVLGKTTYPEGTWLYMSITYQGEKLATTRAIVKANKFSGAFIIPTQVIPTYYDIEIIFSPNRQSGQLLSRLKPLTEQKRVITAQVGDNERIRKEREKTIELFNNMLAQTKTFFDVFYNDFQQKLNDKKLKFDLKLWNATYREYLYNLAKNSDTIKSRTNMYLTVLFPDFEISLKQLLWETNRNFNASTDILISNKDVTDPHGGVISHDDLLAQLRTSFQETYQPLVKSLQLYEKMGDQSFVIAQFRAINGLYKDILGKARDIPTNQISRDNWNLLTAQWRQSAAQIQQDLKTNLKDSLADNFPNLYDNVISLPEHLTGFIDLYTKSFDLKDSKKELAALTEKILNEQLAFQRVFLNLADSFGFKMLALALEPPIAEKSAIEPIPSFASKEEETKYIEDKIQQLNASADKEQAENTVKEMVAMGEITVPFLLKDLPTANKNTVLAILLDLMVFKGQAKEITDEAIKLLERKDVDDDIKIQAIALICQLGEDSTLDYLLKYVANAEAKNNIPFVRCIIGGLGIIGKPSDEVVTYIIKKMGDPELDTRVLAYNILTMLTKMYHDFDPQGPPKTREQQIRNIQNWWEKNKDKYTK